MAKIKDLKAREILDSRANSTLEVDVTLDDGSFGRGSVPSGASTGRYEAYKLEDIKKAILNVNVLEKSLIGIDAGEQEKIDVAMITADGSENKNNLGGNVLLAISIAICEAAARSAKMPLYRYIAKIYGNDNPLKLPVPMFNILNGGKHADNNLPFQEFMVIPVGDGYRKRVETGVTIFKALRQTLKEMGHSVAVGDEGGFAPKLNSDEEALEVILAAIKRTPYAPVKDITIGIDVAASSIPDLKTVTYPQDPISYYEKLIGDYPISYLEDPLSEDDWEGWTNLNTKIGSRVKIVGDDLFTTNRLRLQKGIETKAANSIIIKPDQIGTLTETFQTVRLAQSSGMAVDISHRSGETESTFIADLAVGVGADAIKTGAPSRGERVAKYNQLLRIEEELK